MRYKSAKAPPKGDGTPFGGAGFIADYRSAVIGLTPLIANCIPRSLSGKIT